MRVLPRKEAPCSKEAHGATCVYGSLYSPQHSLTQNSLRMSTSGPLNPYVVPVHSQSLFPKGALSIETVSQPNVDNAILMA